MYYKITLDKGETFTIDNDTEYPMDISIDKVSTMKMIGVNAVQVDNYTITVNSTKNINEERTFDETKGTDSTREG
jgi:hypothetical protein